jgi:hypothetical protein
MVIFLFPFSLPTFFLFPFLSFHLIPSQSISFASLAAWSRWRRKGWAHCAPRLLHPAHLQSSHRHLSAVELPSSNRRRSRRPLPPVRSAGVHHPAPAPPSVDLHLCTSILTSWTPAGPPRPLVTRRPELERLPPTTSSAAAPYMYVGHLLHAAADSPPAVFPASISPAPPPPVPAVPPPPPKGKDG